MQDLCQLLHNFWWYKRIWKTFEGIYKHRNFSIGHLATDGQASAFHTYTRSSKAFPGLGWCQPANPLFKINHIRLERSQPSAGKYQRWLLGQMSTLARWASSCKAVEEEIHSSKSFKDCHGRQQTTTVEMWWIPMFRWGFKDGKWKEIFQSGVEVLVFSDRRPVLGHKSKSRENVVLGREKTYFGDCVEDQMRFSRHP